METLVASLIAAIAILGAMMTFFRIMTLADVSNENSIAYSLARQGIELVKDDGFWYASNGTTVMYYDVKGLNGSSTANSATDRFSVTTVISTDTMNGSAPADTALRTVVVTVKRRPDDTVLETTGTYLVRGGI